MDPVLVNIDAVSSMIETHTLPCLRDMILDYFVPRFDDIFRKRVECLAIDSFRLATRRMSYQGNIFPLFEVIYTTFRCACDELFCAYINEPFMLSSRRFDQFRTQVWVELNPTGILERIQVFLEELAWLSPPCPLHNSAPDLFLDQQKMYHYFRSDARSLDRAARNLDHALKTEAAAPVASRTRKQCLKRTHSNMLDYF